MGSEAPTVSQHLDFILENHEIRAEGGGGRIHPDRNAAEFRVQETKLAA